MKPSVARRHIPQTIPPMTRLHILEQLSGPDVNFQINERARFAYIQDQAYKLTNAAGQCALVVWSRDCDCVETTRQLLIDPSDLRAEVQRLYDDAEGPVTWFVRRPDPEFKTTQRDRVLEAYENGHTWSV